MLIIGHDVLRVLRIKYNQESLVEIIDCHEDKYRLLPNGDIFVHWRQARSPKYSKNGAYVGNLLKDCVVQPKKAAANQP